jgi:hypothetical protein
VRLGISPKSLMLSVLWPFLIGVLGWIAANFAGKPLIEFLSLRKEIQEELIFLSNVYSPRKETREYGEEAYNNERRMFSDAQTTIRRLGSKLNALNASLYKPLPYVLRAMGYDLNDAAKKLLGLSTQYDDNDRTLTRYGVEVALRLPHSEERWVQSITESRREAAELRQKSHHQPEE